MNIGIFTDTYLPRINGVAASCALLRESLIKQGHTVYLFTASEPRAGQDEEGVFRIPSVPFTKAGRIASFYHLSAAHKIRKLNLDVIHTHTEFSLGIFGLMMARELGIRHVHTMHTVYENCTHYIIGDLPFDWLAKPVARSLCAEFCNGADTVIAPTAKVRDMLREYGVFVPVAVVPTGIELSRFSPDSFNRGQVAETRAALGIREKESVLLFVGRLSKEKGIDRLLSLTASLLKKQEVKLLLVGDGPERPELEQLAKQLGISESVVFAGARPWAEIGLYYQLGDVFVGASQSETQGLTYIEALAAGLPVVAASDPCLEDVVIDGACGYQFDTDEQFESAVCNILGDRELHGYMSAQARRAAARFSCEAFAANAVAVYTAPQLSELAVRA